MIQKFIIAFILFFSFNYSLASGIYFSAVVRDSDGSILKNTSCAIISSIIEEKQNNSIYSEVCNTETDNNGRISIYIGNDEYQSDIWKNIDWSKDLSLSTEIDINGIRRVISKSSINYVPKSEFANSTNNLISNSPNGDRWQLNVRNNGDLYWKQLLKDGQAEYPKDKWPTELYLIGDFLNWDPAKSVKFMNPKEGLFVLIHHLNKGDIFKFIEVQSWNGRLDWSGTSGKYKDRAPLKEGGDTPAFEGSDGTYTISVNFNNYTLLIY